MSIRTVTVPQASGGDETFHLDAAATTNAVVIKPSAGQIHGWEITNTNAATRYIVFHDTRDIPIAGQGVFRKFGIPGAGAANVGSLNIQFFNGIAITTVVNPIDNDATAVGLHDFIINISYK